MVSVRQVGKIEEKDTYVRGLLVDWLAEARPFAGQLRTHLARYPS
jgi:hypothetical protein